MPDDLVLISTSEGVTTLTLNLPDRLNGWTMEMITALEGALGGLAENEATKVLVLTGKDPYYSAGVNLGGSLKLDHPKKLHAFIEKRNRALFDMFLNFPKPILVAVNGPAIGAPVTSATLCDGIIASEKATFSTPFARLGVPPEGCSSEVFPRLLGSEADRMLGPEGFKPNAEQALEIGLVTAVVSHDELLDKAHAMAKAWIAEGRERTYPVEFGRDELKAINARESAVLASAFLSPPFLMGQFRFLWSKKKYQLALVFLLMRMTRPIWGLMLP